MIRASCTGHRLGYTFEVGDAGPFRAFVSAHWECHGLRIQVLNEPPIGAVLAVAQHLTDILTTRRGAGLLRAAPADRAQLEALATFIAQALIHGDAAAEPPRESHISELAPRDDDEPKGGTRGA